MKPQSLRQTDAMILIEFEQAVQHLRHREADSEMQSEMRKLSEPFLDRLKRSGHSLAAAIGLMRDVFAHQPPSKVAAAPSNSIYAA